MMHLNQSNYYTKFPTTCRKICENFTARVKICETFTARVKICVRCATQHGGRSSEMGYFPCVINVSPRVCFLKRSIYHSSPRRLIFLLKLSKKFVANLFFIFSRSGWRGDSVCFLLCFCAKLERTDSLSW